MPIPDWNRLHLAHHILSTPSILDPANGGVTLPRILELGAGTGFLSILLAQLGADVVSTDLGDPMGAKAEEDDMRRTPLARLQGNVDLSE